MSEGKAAIGNSGGNGTETAAPVLPLSQNREYCWWLSGEIAREFGSAIGGFAFPLITLAITRDPALTGTVAFLGGMGTVFGTLPGGIMADRFDRRNLRMLSALLGVLIQAILITVLLAGLAYWWCLAIIAFLDRFRSSFLGFSSMVMLKQIVDSKQLPSAMAINQGRAAAIGMAGNPISGLLLSLATVLPAIVDLCCYGLAALTTVFMKGNYHPRIEENEKTSLLQDFKASFNWLKAEPLRYHLVIIALFGNLGLNGILMLVVLFLGSNHTDTAVIGLLYTCFAGAILLGSLVAGKVTKIFPVGKFFVVVVAYSALLSIALTFTDGSLWVWFLFVILLGLPNSPMNAGMGGYIMHIIPNELQGRVMSVIGLIGMGLVPLGQGFAGWGLSYLGLKPTLLIFAGVIGVGGLLALFSKPVRSIPKSDAW